MNFVRVFVRRMSQKKTWEPLKKVGIIGVPFEKGQKKYGVSVAPAAMRSAGLIEALKEIGTSKTTYPYLHYKSVNLRLSIISLLTNTAVFTAKLLTRS